MRDDISQILQSLEQTLNEKLKQLDKYLNHVKRIKQSIKEEQYELAMDLHIETEEIADFIDNGSYEASHLKDDLISKTGIHYDDIDEFYETYHPEISVIQKRIKEILSNIDIDYKEIDSILEDQKRASQKDLHDLSSIIRIGKARNLLNEQS